MVTHVKETDLFSEAIGMHCLNKVCPYQSIHLAFWKFNISDIQVDISGRREKLNLGVGLSECPCTQCFHMNESNKP